MINDTFLRKIIEKYEFRQKYFSVISVIQLLIIFQLLVPNLFRFLETCGNWSVLSDINLKNLRSSRS